MTDFYFFNYIMSFSIQIGAGEGVYDFSKVRTIKCRYLRIHITDVNNHDDTFLRRNRATLHKIEIYGEDSTTDLETLRKKLNLILTTII